MNKKLKIFPALGFAGAAFILLTACPTERSGGRAVESPPPSPPQAEAETTSFQDDGSGWIRFQTNDPRYSGESGSTVWRIGSLDESPMRVFSALVVKESGASKAGFGIVFCASESRFLAFLIDTEGAFCVGAVENGAWSYLDPEKPWKRTSYLHRGYGISNTISAKRITGNGPPEFSMSVNGMEVERFLDPGGTISEGGRFGFICVVGTDADEDFPERPVSARFLEIEPIDIRIRGASARSGDPACASTITGSLDRGVCR